MYIHNVFNSVKETYVFNQNMYIINYTQVNMYTFYIVFVIITFS